MVPRSIGTSPLMQRSSVDLPEPDGPMMQTTLALARPSSEMPFSTSTAAERLVDVVEDDDGFGGGAAVPVTLLSD